MADVIQAPPGPMQPLETVDVVDEVNHARAFQASEAGPSYQPTIAWAGDPVKRAKVNNRMLIRYRGNKRAYEGGSRWCVPFRR